MTQKKGPVNGHFVLLNQEGLANVLHKHHCSDSSVYRTECTATVRDLSRGITKDYPVFKDRRGRCSITPWVEGRGLATVFMDEFH